MTDQPSEEQGGRRSPPETTFNDLKKEIAERNERAQKEARDLRVLREREQLGIVSRHRLDLDR
jgi:hypothetical protein